MNPFIHQMIEDTLAGHGRTAGRITIVFGYAEASATAYGPGRDHKVRAKRLRLPPVGDFAALDAVVAAAERHFAPHKVSTVIVAEPPLWTHEVASAFRDAVARLAEVRNIFTMVVLDPATKARAAELGLEVPPMTLRADGTVKVRDPEGGIWELDSLQPGPFIYGIRTPPEAGTAAS